MTDLTAWLLERIAEDEERAENAIGDRPPGASMTGAFAGEYGPVRVLAECAAKRRIVEAAQRTQASLENRRAPATDAINGHVIAYRDVVRLLALPYADHPDYREEWL